MTFCASLRARLDAPWRACLEHPFVRGIGRGDLPREAFRRYLEQDGIYLVELGRFLGLAAARAPDVESMRLFSRLLDSTLTVELDLHRRACEAAGIPPASLDGIEATPTCLAYTSFLLATAALGTAEDAVAALLPCFWGYAEIGRALAAAGLPDDAVYRDWIETYAAPEFEELVAWLVAWLDGRAPESAAGRRRLEGTFRTAVRYEWMFFEAAWRGEGWAV